MKISIIGTGFSSLSAATFLADEGHEVTVFEKNETAGGRARSFFAHGFTFDMGPSWYWMPNVFEEYFKSFGKKITDYYQLKRLDPSYRVYFGEKDLMDLPASMHALEALFESYEPGSGEKLKKFLSQAKFKYEVGINDLVYKPSRSLSEFLDIRLLKGLFKMDVFLSMHKHVRKFFKHEKLLKLVEFPVLFLGAEAKNTPALYSLMNYADMALGTWYPEGGMHKIIEGMISLAKEKGVNFKLSHNVTGIQREKNEVKAIHTSEGSFDTDVLVAGADYHHIDSKILGNDSRNYNDRYWDKRVLAPSSLIFYLGINKKVKGLLHHNLFFDEDLDAHAKEIYAAPQWPQKPLFYASAPSKTDKTVAPADHENIFLLMPIAPGLIDNEEMRQKYLDIMLTRLEKLTGDTIREHIIFKRGYCINDFIEDYNAYKGNAYGLANTLRQTAILKPSLKNKKLRNVYYTGQLTVPGPGVPPSIISGQVVAREILKDFSSLND